MTLGNAAAAHVRLIVWCLDCRHQVEPDPAEMAERYGAEMTAPTGTSGWCAVNAAAGGSISSLPASGGAHNASFGKSSASHNISRTTRASSS
jgi:hypothetical protein